MDASFTKTGQRYTLSFERQLAHSPEKVWRVLTERDLMRQWFPCDVQGNWEVGAPLRFTFLNGEGEGLPDEVLQGEVLAVDPPHHLEFRWGENFYVCKLVAEGNGCKLIFSDSFDDPSSGARNAAGWELCLANLDLLLEGAAAAKFVTEVWQEKFEHYVKMLEKEAGPQQGMPESYPVGAD